MPGDDLCVWCNKAVGPHEGYRSYELPSGHSAAFCRLEHIVPWTIRGARWPAGGASAIRENGRGAGGDDPGARESGQGGAESGAGAGESTPSDCSHCHARLQAERVLLVHRRGEHRIIHAFCDVAHMNAWAKAGGPWR